MSSGSIGGAIALAVITGGAASYYCCAGPTGKERSRKGGKKGKKKGKGKKGSKGKKKAKKKGKKKENEGGAAARVRAQPEPEPEPRRVTGQTPAARASPAARTSPAASRASPAASRIAPARAGSPSPLADGVHTNVPVSRLLASQAKAVGAPAGSGSIRPGQRGLPAAAPEAEYGDEDDRRLTESLQKMEATA